MSRNELLTDATEIDFFKISKNYVSIFAYSNSLVHTYPMYLIWHSKQLHNQSLHL